MTNDSGRSPSGRDGHEPNPQAVSAVPVAIPIALLAGVADDLIALAEYAYEDNASIDDAPLEDAYCDADGVCHWGVCRASGCIIDKYHRGLALQSAQAIEARRAATLGAVHESAVLAEDAPTSPPKTSNPCTQGEVG